MMTNDNPSHLAVMLSILRHWESAGDEMHQMYRAVYDAVAARLLSRAAESYLSRDVVGVVELLTAGKCPAEPMRVRDEIAGLQRCNARFLPPFSAPSRSDYASAVLYNLVNDDVFTTDTNAWLLAHLSDLVAILAHQEELTPNAVEDTVLRIARMCS